MFITRWIINAILLKLTGGLTDHLKIDSFGWALLGALMSSAIGTLGSPGNVHRAGRGPERGSPSAQRLGS